MPKGSTINLIVNKLDKKIVLYSHRVSSHFSFIVSFGKLEFYFKIIFVPENKANQIKNMIDAYCAELDKVSLKGEKVGK